MRNFSKIVLTGGSCGGKTELLPILKELYVAKGYNVYTLSEPVRYLFDNGINSLIVNDSRISTYSFQYLVFLTQYIREYMLEREILSVNDKSLLICDRGLLDNKAYIDSEGFNNILRQSNKKERELLETYNIIIHLVSSAVNNPAFFEKCKPFDIEQTIITEKKLQTAWESGRKRTIIDYRDKFEDKVTATFEFIERGILRLDNAALPDYYDNADFDFLQNELAEIIDGYCENSNGKEKNKVLRLKKQYQEEGIIRC